MIHIIRFQNGKNINEIMFEMSEKTSRDKFQKRETFIRNNYIAAAVLSAISCAYIMVDYMFLGGGNGSVYN